MKKIDSLALKVAAVDSSSLEMTEILTYIHKNFFWIVYKRVHSKEDTEDILQEACIRVFLKLNTFDSTKASFSKWVEVIVSNLISDFFREKKKKEKITTDLTPKLIRDKKHLITPMHILEGIDLERMLREVPFLESERVMFEHKYKGLECFEIAQMFNVSLQTVKALVYRARQRISRYIQEENSFFSRNMSK